MINWSRIIGVLTLISTVLGIAAHYFGGWIPDAYMPIVVGLQAAVLAFVERVQGGKSKG